MKQDKWQWVIVENEHFSRLSQEKNKPNFGNLGKYLLFCEDKNLLYKMALSIMNTFNLSTFKINKESSDNGDFSFVAAIYDINKSFYKEISIIVDKSPNILFRGFKKEIASYKGQYSKQYLNSLE